MFVSLIYRNRQLNPNEFIAPLIQNNHITLHLSLIGGLQGGGFKAAEVGLYNVKSGGLCLLRAVLLFMDPCLHSHPEYLDDQALKLKNQTLLRLCETPHRYIHAGKYSHGIEVKISNSWNRQNPSADFILCKSDQEYMRALSEPTSFLNDDFTRALCDQLGVCIRGKSPAYNSFCFVDYHPCPKRTFFECTAPTNLCVTHGLTSLQPVLFLLQILQPR